MTAFAIIATSALVTFEFVLWLNKAKHEAQKDGVCDFSGQGRDEWKNS